MASPKRPQGVVRARVAENLKRVRKQRGLSTYELAAKLEKIGWPILQSGVARIEAGERRVDVDDLMALAVCLDCSPNLLLMPDTSRLPAWRPVPVVGDVTSVDKDVWAWATGETPLIQIGEPYTVMGGKVTVHAFWQPSGPDIAAFKVANQPHHYLTPEDDDGEG